MENMFCYQCEQTANCSGCTGNRGVCGKTADVANLQDALTGALIGLARATDGNEKVTKDTWHLMASALFATLTNVNFSAEDIERFTNDVHAETARLVPDCSCCQSPCGHNADYDMQKLWTAQEDIRSLKSLILFGIRGMAAYRTTRSCSAMRMKKSAAFLPRRSLPSAKTGAWKSFCRSSWR